MISNSCSTALQPWASETVSTLFCCHDSSFTSFPLSVTLTFTTCFSLSLFPLFFSCLCVWNLFVSYPFSLRPSAPAMLPSCDWLSVAEAEQWNSGQLLEKGMRMREGRSSVEPLVLQLWITTVAHRHREHTEAKRQGEGRDDDRGGCERGRRRRRTLEEISQQIAMWLVVVTDKRGRGGEGRNKQLREQCRGLSQGARHESGVWRATASTFFTAHLNLIKKSMQFQWLSPRFTPGEPVSYIEKAQGRSLLDRVTQGQWWVQFPTLEKGKKKPLLCLSISIKIPPLRWLDIRIRISLKRFQSELWVSPIQVTWHGGDGGGVGAVRGSGGSQ